MLQRIVSLSVKHRGAVIALACATLLYGVYVAAHSKFDVYPEFAPPQVVIQTEAPGMSPEEVEQLVTRPIETAVNGTPDLEFIRSQSIQGLSVITMSFEDNSDIYRVRQMTAERLSELSGRLPQGVETPALAPLTGTTCTFLILGLTSDSRSLADLRTYAEWTLRPRLLSVPGVARASIYGGDVRQLQIQVSPERLAAHNIGLNEILNAGRRATGIRGAGFVDTASQRITIRTRGQALTPADLGEGVVGSYQGVPVRLKDVAEVADGVEPKNGDGAINGKQGVLLVMSSQFRANTIEVTDAVERALEEMKPEMSRQGITLHPKLFRPANFIETAVRNVNRSLLIGGVLVTVVLFVFLWNVRIAFISLTAIPLSLMAAVIVLDRFGISLNTLTLGGLAIAIGEVVDDAIIDAENIFRRLRENSHSPAPRSAFQVVLDASLEVRSAVVYATFVVILVFIPVLMMSGLQGRLFAPLGLAYIFAIVASLAVALTVTPALSYVMLAGGDERHSETRFAVRLKKQYERLLAFVAGRPRAVMAGAALMCVAAAAVIPFLGGEFLPEMREGHFIVHMSAIPGTSLDESVRLGALVSRELLKNAKVASVAQQVGRAELAEDTWGTHYTELHVALKPMPAEEAERIEGEIRKTLSSFPGVHFAVRPFLVERIEEILSGVTAQVVIKIFGDDLSAIDRSSRQVAQVLGAVRGAADVQIEAPPGVPLMMVDLRKDRLQQYGFQPVDVLEAVQTSYQGSVVAQAYDANRVFNVAVILDKEHRRNPEALGSLLLTNPAGARVPLRELTDSYQTTGNYAVLHEATRRRQAVTCNVRGRDVQSFVEDARRQISGAVRFPAGVYPVFGGTEQARQKAQRDLLMHSLLAALVIVVLLAVVFRNGRNLLLVLVNLPFALVGGVLAAFASGGNLSIGSMVGFVTVFGITMRNSMMLISHYEHLVEVEGMAWGPGAILRGATERLIPVLMTALVTALGLLPLAIGSGEAGREIEGPMAIVILGGLVTSTLLTLTVLPTLAGRWGKFD